MHASMNGQTILDGWNNTKERRSKCFQNCVIFDYGVLGRSRTLPEDDSNRLYMHAWIDKQYLMGETIAKKEDPNAS